MTQQAGGNRPAERHVRLSAEAVADLAGVPDLRSEFEATTPVPLVGSPNWSDRAAVSGPLGERPGASASAKLALAIDHAENVRQIVLDHATLPAWAHLTLARPVFEASVQVRWLLEPGATPRERVGRAVAAALKDLYWRSQIEGDMRAAGWTPSASFQTAAARVAEVRAQATDAGIPTIRMPDTTQLMADYSLEAGRSDAWLFRYTSGVLHSQGWAASIGDAEHFVGETYSYLRHETSTDISVTVLAAAARHLAEALKAYRRYMDSSSASAGV